MREVIIAITVLFVVSTAFSYSYIPKVVSGSFNIVSDIKSANQSDFVLLLPPNWSVENVQYSGNLTNKEILIKDLYGKTYLAIHLSFSGNSHITITVYPTSSGYVYLYNIKDNGNFEKKSTFVKLTKSIDIIPFLLAVLPFWVFFSHENIKEIKKEKSKKIKKHKRVRRKKK